MTEKVLIFLSLLSFVYISVDAQDRQIFFENLREQEGLTYHLVQDIDQDTLGRLWVSTYNGLYAYDGYQFKAYQHATTDTNSISSNLIRSSIVDHAQRIWIGTEKDGLCVLNQNTNNVIRFPISIFGSEESDNSVKINHLAEDFQHHLWVVSSKALYRFSFDGSKLQIVDIPAFPESFLENDIVDIYPDKNRRIWFATNKGLFAFDIGSNQWISYEDSSIILKGKISDVLEDKSGNIWIGVRDKNGIYKISEGTMLPIAYPFVNNFESANRVHLCIDHKGHLWVGAGRAGVYRHNLATKENQFFEGKDYEQGTGNFSNYTHSPMVDRFGNVWFCGGGIHKWSNTYKNFTHYAHPFGNYQSTAAIYDDENFRLSSLWGKGVVVWNKKSDHYFELQKQNGLFSDRVYAFVPYKENTYLLGGEGGYQLVDLEKEKLGEFVKLKGTIYHGIKENDKFILGGSRGLWQIKNGKIESILPKINLRYFKKSTDDNFWIATLSRGLINWDRFLDTIVSYTRKTDMLNGIQSNRVEHLDIDSEGRIWMATGAGVESFNPETSKWKHFNEDTHIAGIRANAIHIIGDSSVWLSNNQGISSLHLSNQKWTHFNTEDGMLNTYFYERSSYLNQQGRLFFGGRLGIVHFTPEDLKQNPIPPNLYFDEIKIDNELLTPHLPHRKKLDLDWKHRFFEINFTGLQLTDPLSVKYKYRLLPQQNEWITIQKQSLFFSGISVGNYQLEIIAFNGDGIPSPQTLTLDIEVKGPFWKKNWFILLCLCLIAMAIGWYFKNTKLKYQRKINLEHRLNEIERSALRSQMNPHFIFNAMSSIQHFIIEGDELNALKYLSTLSRIIRKVLDYSIKDFIPMDEELALLKDYIQLEQLRFGEKIDCVINVSESIHPELINIPPMLLQPLVENAINHGLRQLENREKSLQLNFEKMDGNSLAVQVVDNGVGRKESLLSKKKDHNSNGTRNVKTRLQLIGEQLEVSTTFEIIDLVNETGAALGTLVKLQIPYQII